MPKIIIILLLLLPLRCWSQDIAAPAYLNKVREFIADLRRSDNLLSRKKRWVIIREPYAYNYHINTRSEREILMSYFDWRDIPRKPFKKVTSPFGSDIDYNIDSLELSQEERQEFLKYQHQNIELNWANIELENVSFISCDSVVIAFQPPITLEIWESSFRDGFLEFSFPIFFRNDSLAFFYRGTVNLSDESEWGIYKKEKNGWREFTSIRRFQY